MADMGKTEVDATVQETVSAIIQDQLIQNAKLLPTITSVPVAMGEDKIKVPRAGNFSVDTKVENTSVTAQVISYQTDDIDLDQDKVIQVILEDRARLQGQQGIRSDIIMRMGKQMALDIDEFIVTLLENTSSAAPDHRIAYDAANLGKADLLNARELIHIQNLEFNECTVLVHPTAEKSLLAISDFVSADTYGSADGLRLGELGRLYGARVIMSNVADPLKTLVYHPSHVYFAMQVGVRFEQDRIVEKLADLFSINQLYGGQTMDSGVRGVLLGTAV